jgi:AcrR family transcriptional regulator
VDKKTDLRIIKTYKALTEAFWQILSDHKYEDITVNVLCERAMVRRATFYKHFADKNDFFAFVIREKQAEYGAQTQPQADNNRAPFFYLEIFQHSLDFLNSNKKLAQTVLESNTLPTVMDILARQISIDISRNLKADAKNRIPLPASPQVMAQFFTGALIYVMTWWVKQESLSEAKLIEELTSLLRNFSPLNGHPLPT